MFKTIENASAVHEDDIIDLGVASVETKGGMDQPGPDSVDPQRFNPSGLSAD